MWQRLEGREIRRRYASSARTAARRGITRPDTGDRPRPDLPEGADLLPQIKHIVILMMENHSYDNYLGMLADRGEGLLLGPDGTPDVVNYLPNGRGYRAHHMTSTTQVKNDPSQNWHSTHIQYADGRNDGFAAAVANVLARRLFGGRGLTAARRLAQVGRWLPGMANRAVGNKSFTADLYPLGLASCVRHLRKTEQFFADADAGTLPAVSIVDPDFETYSEENPQDITKGESFAAEVIGRVMSGPGWSHTLLIWLYDEHGGYYDHVPPPEAVLADDVPAHNYILDLPRWLRTLLSPVFGGGFARLKAIDDGPRDYARYGFRVPAVIVSPYARPDYVCSTTFDHTSVLKLIEEKWNLPPLTRRDAAASSPLDMVDLEAEPAFAEPPKLPEPTLRWGSWSRPRQRRGRRPRRRRAVAANR